MVGKPVGLREWQRVAIREIYDNPHGTRRAILSFGRKNGKTALAAFLLLLHLCGPEAVANSQMYSAAQSRDQAGLLFDLAAKCVRLSPELHKHIQIRDTAKEILYPGLGTFYKALSAEATPAFGLNPRFVVHDELGQVRGPRSSLYEALETATAAQDDPLSIIISTQAPTEADLLSVLIDDALAGHDPRVVVKLWTADKDLDPFAEKTIRTANPAFGDFQNSAEVLAMAEDARRMPSREAEYRNLILNQRVEANSPFVSASVWAACGSEAAPIDGVPVYGGLDLSAVRDLTALVLIGQVDGVWQVHPTFWLPGEGLAQKARADRVPYDLWQEQGYLETAPGKSVEYEFVADYLRDVFARYEVQKIAFDRWGWRHLRPWLLKAGFTEDELDEHFVEFGQGLQSMSPALRELESDLLAGNLAHGNHPVLTMCAANAVVKTDPAGNRKLDKSRSAGRIDGMVALTMARGAEAMTIDEFVDVRAMVG
jgi:phage terminase large subunit-like protein